MMRSYLGLMALLLTLLLAGCAGAPVPDVAYYRMPEVAAGKMSDSKHFNIPIVVDSLIADGVYNDQAILYTLRSEGSIKAYHYQLWDEPPGQLLQRRLIDTLRARNASKLITDRLPPSIDSLRVSGRIERFERVKTETGWLARVRLELRAEHGAQQEPLLLSEYGADVPAAADSIQATVRAFAAAIDQSYDAFWSELQQVQQ
jgi:cholesterol transport system auxiliary component